jgi:hypothetical protein
MKKRDKPPAEVIYGRPGAGKTCRSGSEFIQQLLDSDTRLFPASQLPAPAAPKRRRAKKGGPG